MINFYYASINKADIWTCLNEYLLYGEGNVFVLVKALFSGLKELSTMYHSSPSS